MIFDNSLNLRYAIFLNSWFTLCVFCALIRRSISIHFQVRERLVIPPSIWISSSVSDAPSWFLAIISFARYQLYAQTRMSLSISFLLFRYAAAIVIPTYICRIFSLCVIASVYWANNNVVYYIHCLHVFIFRFPPALSGLYYFSHTSRCKLLYFLPIPSFIPSVVSPYLRMLPIAAAQRSNLPPPLFS